METLLSFWATEWKPDAGYLMDKNALRSSRASGSAEIGSQAVEVAASGTFHASRRSPPPNGAYLHSILPPSKVAPIGKLSDFAEAISSALCPR
jgi:hypothetical protein